MKRLFPKPGTLFIIKQGNIPSYFGEKFRKFDYFEKGEILMFISHRKRRNYRTCRFLNSEGIVVEWFRREPGGDRKDFDFVFEELKRRS